MSAEDMKTVEDALRWALSRIDPMNRGDYWDRASRILADADTNPEAAAPLTDEQIEAGFRNFDWSSVPHPFRGSVGFERGARWAEQRIRASLARQAPEAAARWIPVSERLPESRVRVLAWDGAIVATATCYSGEWGSVIHMRDVTHWMPLPPAPEATAGEKP